MSYENEPRKPRGQKGLTLLEAMIAILLLGIVLIGLVPSLLAFTDVNTANEIRSEALQAAQMEMEALRSMDLSVVPQTTGTLSTQNVVVGNRTYEVTTRHCVDTLLCNSDSRHFIVEVKLDGRTFYTAESVFTALL